MREKIKIAYFATLFVYTAATAQMRVVLNNNPYINISSSAYLVIDNSNANAITTLGTGGNIISESETNVVKWNIGAATGNYIVPFTTGSLVKIPLAVNIVTAGVGASGSIIFSTYETATDANTVYPSDVSNMNSNCNNNNALYAVDRFWRIDAGSYTTKPTPVINFGYNDAANEIGATNTIIESKLKAERFNAGANAWETPQKLYGIANAILNTVSGVSVIPADFYKSWTLIDTTIMTIPISNITASSNTICSGNSSIITNSGATNYTLMPGALTTTTSFTVSPISITVYTITGSIGSGTATCTSAPSSAANTTITVNATPTIAIGSISSNTICSGQSVTLTPTGGSGSNYTITPGSATGSSFTISPTSTTVYTISGASALGCLSTAASNLTTTIIVNSTPTVGIASVSSNTICSGNSSIITPSGASSYTLLPNNTSGTSFTVSPTATTIYTISGSSTLACVSTAITNPTLTITVNTTPTVGIATVSSNTICSGNSSIITPSGASSYTLQPNNTSGTSFTVSPTATTIYTISGSSTLACVSTAITNPTLTITVNTTPTVGIATVSSNTICSGNSSIITPSGASSYTLQPNNTSGTSFTVSPTSTTIYTISGSSTLACVSTAITNPTLSITVDTSPTVGIASVVNNTICSGASAIITPSGAVSYTLLPNNTIGTSFTITPTSTTIYTISGISAAGCTSSLTSNPTVTITVSTTPTVTILSANNTTPCAGTSATIIPNGASTYTLLPTNAVGTSFTVAPTVTTTYTLVGVNALGCLSNAITNPTIQITSGIIPIQPASINNITCNGYNDGIIGLSILGGMATYSFTWSNSASTPTISGLASGNYSVIILSANSCTLAQTFTISEPIGIALTSGTLIGASCQQNATGSINLSLIGGTPAYQVNWSNGFSGLSNSNFPSGVYTATVTDQNNCKKQFVFTVDTLSISNSQCVDLLIPEVISPNGDGKNDFLVITKIEAFPNNILSIFNRWGSLVYQKKAYSNDWSGKANVSDAFGNGLLPSGTYFIVLDFGDEVSKPYNGYIELQY